MASASSDGGVGSDSEVCRCLVNLWTDTKETSPVFAADEFFYRFRSGRPDDDAARKFFNAWISFIGSDTDEGVHRLTTDILSAMGDAYCDMGASRSALDVLVCVLESMAHNLVDEELESSRATALLNLGSIAALAARAPHVFDLFVDDLVGGKEPRAQIAGGVEADGPEVAVQVEVRAGAQDPIGSARNDPDQADARGAGLIDDGDVQLAARQGGN